MARLLALCSLPRTNPGNRKEYKRVNGPYTLYMNAVGGCKLPFGNLPRLLLAWVCTEAVRTQSRELVLGRSLSKFMRTLGINSTSGGVRGEQTRLRNQMKRLFGCTVSLLYQGSAGTLPGGVGGPATRGAGFVGKSAFRSGARDREQGGRILPREPGRVGETGAGGGAIGRALTALW